MNTTPVVDAIDELIKQSLLLASADKYENISYYEAIERNVEDARNNLTSKLWDLCESVRAATLASKET